MGSPPQPSGKLRLVLLILGLCCVPVICQDMKIENVRQEKKNSLYKSLDLKKVKMTVEACNKMSHKCPILRKKFNTPLKDRPVYYFMDMYLNHTKREGNPDTMSGKEFTDYLKVDIPDYIEDIVKKAMTSLDEDKDGELNMEEYFKFFLNFMTDKFGPVKNKGQ